MSSLGIFGTGAWGSFVWGAGANTLADDQIDVAYLVAIEGLEYLWVTDHTGDVLLGSGSQSWIGQYEAATGYTDHETVGQRVVLGGLKMPGRIPKGKLNVKSGKLETTQLTLELLDVDDILPTLFASESKPFNVLGERVPPGTAALGASLIIEGAETLDPVGRYIGIERIGPGRERAWFSPFPWAGIGLHHQVHTGLPQGIEGPAPTRISEAPLQFAGRKVFVWKLYRDSSDATASRTEWAHWGVQAQLGPPEFVGVMRDSGEYDGAGVWSIQCFGIESLLRKRLGTADQGWTNVASAPVDLAEVERGIGLRYYLVATNGDESDFDSILIGTETLPATGTREDYAEALQTIIEGVGDNSIASDFGAAPCFDEDFGTESPTRFSLQTDGVRARRGNGGTEGMPVMRLCMHENVWRVLGYEPGFQAVGWGHAPNNTKEIVFRHHESGDDWAQSGDNNAVGPGRQTPGENYWVGDFHTATLGYSPQGVPDEEMDNGGTSRLFRPFFPEQPIILSSPSANQRFTIGADAPYLEGDPTIDSDTYDAARYFVFRGTRAVGDITAGGQVVQDDGQVVSPDDIESEDFAAVGLVRWDRSGSAYGTNDGEFRIERWTVSRRFGVDHPKLDGEWSALSSGDYEIQCAPLHAYAYQEGSDSNEPLDRAWAVFGQLLLSTGTAAGYSGGVFSDGENSPTTNNTTAWCSDVVSSELGLGIPHQLVASPAEIYNAFGEVTGGPQGPLQQVRYAYAEPFQSQDLLDSLLRSRGLSMSLRGGKFGVTKLGVFSPGDADAVIDDNSIVVRNIEDPSSVQISQKLRATGAVDQTNLENRHDPSKGERLGDFAFPSRDPGARFRRGDIEDPITDDGLPMPGWTNELTINGWLGHFRQLHTVERATWLNKRHFSIRCTVHRIDGQNLWPGARVLFSSERVYTAAGALGITNAVGHVLSVDARPRDQEYDLELLIYADQVRLPIFAPVGKVESISGANVRLVPDAQFLDHGDGLDSTKFDRPSWITTGTGARVNLWQYDRRGWSMVTTSLHVASVSGHVVTLDGPLVLPHANRDYYLVLAPYDDQPVGSWPRAACLPYCLDTRQFGSGPTDGWPYLDA